MNYINKESINYIKNQGDILACKYYHKSFYPNGADTIGDCEAERINDKNWDVFHVQYETKDAYYGVPMLGIGLMDCMILKSDTRLFLESELNYNVGLFGSNSGKLSRKYNIEIEPIVDKF